MLGNQSPNSPRERAIRRGRDLVERYAHQSTELGESIDEQASAARDLIADVLAYVTSLPDRAFGPAYVTEEVDRVAAVAAGGVWDTLAELLSNSNPGADPDLEILDAAATTFCEQLRPSPTGP